MKKLLILIGAIAAYGQTVSISDTLTNAVGGGSYTGRITVTLNAPGNASPLYYSTTSLTGWQAVYCLGVTGSDCTTTTAAGVFAATLYANSTITPAGTSYSARFTPAKGSPWSEVWVVTPSTTTLRQVRSSTVPTPTTTFQPSQIVPGTNGQVITTTAGATAWGSVPACATCVVTSGSYADPAWITSLAGSKVSGAVASATTATALAANGTNCVAGMFPLGVDASGNSESCTTLPTTISGTANQITASASTGAVTLSLPATITGLTSVTSTGFTGDLTGNASTATALASTVASGRLWIGQGTGVPTSDADLYWDSANKRIILGSGSTAINSDDKLSVSAASIRFTIASTTNGNNAGFRLKAYSSGGTVRQGGVYFIPGSTTSNTYLCLAPDDTNCFANSFANGNVAIGTTTDLGYGLHAANKATNGNFLCFDPTATTGVTTCVVRDGAAQAGSSSIVVQNSSSQYIAGFTSNTGSTHGFWVATTAGGTFGTGLTAGGVQLSSTRKVTFSSTTDAFTGTADTSLSRASAGVLQVGDGGANANGYLSAARIGVGTASPLTPLHASGAGIIGSTNPTIDTYFSLAVTQRPALDSFATFKLAPVAGSTRGWHFDVYDNSTTAQYFQIYDNTNAATRLKIYNSGNISLGGTTDGNYKLDVQNSGSSGTLRIYDQTATTGNTKEVIRAGAGQSTNLTEWQNNAGTVLARVDINGNVISAAGLTAGTDLAAGGAAAIYWVGRSIMTSPSDSVIRLTNTSQTDFSRLQFGGTTSSFPALKRSSAILQARLADDSAYTDIGVNAVIVNKAAPSASSDACTAGQLWAGDMGGTKYAFYCVASGTIVRSAFASF